MQAQTEVLLNEMLSRTRTSLEFTISLFLENIFEALLHSLHLPLILFLMISFLSMIFSFGLMIYRIYKKWKQAQEVLKVARNL